MTPALTRRPPRVTTYTAGHEVDERHAAVGPSQLLEAGLMAAPTLPPPWKE
jgi:hypothetical protein